MDEQLVARLSTVPGAGLPMNGRGFAVKNNTAPCVWRKPLRLIGSIFSGRRCPSRKCRNGTPLWWCAAAFAMILLITGGVFHHQYQDNQAATQHPVVDPISHNPSFVGPQRPREGVFEGHAESPRGGDSATRSILNATRGFQTR